MAILRPREEGQHREVSPVPTASHPSANNAHCPSFLASSQANEVKCVWWSEN